MLPKRTCSLGKTVENAIEKEVIKNNNRGCHTYKRRYNQIIKSFNKKRLGQKEKC